MTVLDVRPAKAGTAAAPHRIRHHPKWLVLLISLVIVCVGAAGAAAFAVTYFTTPPPTI